MFSARRHKNAPPRNHIEGLWSALKRWIRARHGGRLPSSSETTERDMFEFMWRKWKAEHGSQDPVKDVLSALVFAYAEEGAEI